MKKIPEGFTSITPYLVFDDTAAAMDFYKKALGAVEIARLGGDAGNVFYGELQIGNARIMMGDVDHRYGGQSAETLGGTPLYLYHYVENIETAFEKAKAAEVVEAEDSETRRLAASYW